MFPVNLYTTNGLSILMHGIISLPDVTSYDKELYLKSIGKGFFVMQGNNINVSYSDIECMLNENEIQISTYHVCH